MTPWCRTLSICCAITLLSLPAAAEKSLPEIDLSRLEPQVQSRLRSAHRTLLAALDEEASSAVERAQLLGATGELFQANGVMEFAIACYREASELTPDAFRWRYLLGVAAQESGSFDEAAEHFRRALELRSDDAPARLRLARVELARGDLAAARKLLLKLTDEEGVAAAAHADLATIAEATHELDGAIEHYRAALDKQPQAAQLYYPLAAAVRRAGKVAQAQKLAARASPSARIRFVDPIVEEVSSLTAGSEIYSRLATRAIRSGDLEAASEALRVALELRPDDDRARSNLAAVELERGNLAAAERLLRQTLNRDPDYAHAHFNLGRLLERRGAMDEAAGHYAAAVEADPTNSEFLFGQSRLLLRNGDYVTATGRLAVLVERAPGFLQARYLLALAQEAGGDRAAARKTLAEARRLEPARTDIALALVRVTSTWEDASSEQRLEALALADTLYQRQRDADRTEALAMALAATERFDEAVRLQETLIEAARRQSVAADAATFLQANLERYRNRRLAVGPWSQQKAIPRR